MTNTTRTMTIKDLHKNTFSQAVVSIARAELRIESSMTVDYEFGAAKPNEQKNHTLIYGVHYWPDAQAFEQKAVPMMFLFNPNENVQYFSVSDEVMSELAALAGSDKIQAITNLAFDAFTAHISGGAA